MASAGERNFGRWLVAICLAAFALRLGIRAITGTERYWTDGYGLYIQLAESIGQGRGYALAGQEPTAYRVPLYPLFIWAVTGGGHRIAWALITAQAAVSAGTAGMAGLIARRMAGPAAGLFAAALYALWPYGAWHDVSLQESGLFAFLAALATWALLVARGRRTAIAAIGAGAALGLAMLTRATLLPFTLGALAWLVLPARLEKASLARRAGTALLALCAFALVLGPWLERAHRMTGTYGLGTESGQALYAGNHPLTFSAYPTGSIDESRSRIFAAHTPAERAELARLDEAGMDRWYRDKGIAEITGSPAAFAAGALRKLWAAFGPWPVPRHSLPADLAYMATWLPFLALGLAGMALRRREWRADGLLWWHFATFALTTALFWAQTAHRSYLDPFIAVFGGVALARLVPAAKARLRSRAS